MKRHIIQIALAIVLAFAPVIITHAQPRPDSYDEEGSPLREGPIGGGLVLLLVMAGAYGAKKVYDARTRMKE